MSTPPLSPCPFIPLRIMPENCKIANFEKRNIYIYIILGT